MAAYSCGGSCGIGRIGPHRIPVSPSWKAPMTTLISTIGRGTSNTVRIGDGVRSCLRLWRCNGAEFGRSSQDSCLHRRFPASIGEGSMNIDPSAAPHFDEAFRARLLDLFCWRRDVRRFRRDPLQPGMLERLIEVACQAPSVGLCQPWRFVVVDDPGRRQEVIDNFESCNGDALRGIYGRSIDAIRRLETGRTARGAMSSGCVCRSLNRRRPRSWPTHDARNG